MALLVSAIIANLHDVVIILGFFAFFQWEFSLPVLAAVLAVLGYSVNEIGRRLRPVRETFKKVRGLTTPQVLDHAITSTISPHHHHARFDAADGALDAALRRRDAAPLRRCADHRHLLWHLLFGAVASPLVMWLGVSRENFIKVKQSRSKAPTRTVPSFSAELAPERRCPNGWLYGRQSAPFISSVSHVGMARTMNTERIKVWDLPVRIFTGCCSSF